VGSSYVHATARDFARFGYLYLRDGVWDGRRVVPEGWVDHGRRPRSVDPGDGRLHGAHWWALDDESGTFWASGYEGQSIVVCPALDLVVVRLGKTLTDGDEALWGWRAALIGALGSA
jgi:CubicO group peptidase (beta-lactamase class C family)